jgi:hypothetical protein
VQVSRRDTMEEPTKEFMDELTQKLANEIVEWYIDLALKRQDYLKKLEKERFEEYSKAVKKVFGEPK